MLSTNGGEKKGGWKQYWLPWTDTGLAAMRLQPGLKSFSTSALLGLWGMLESRVSGGILGAGQQLHLFSTVSGLEKTLRESQRREHRIFAAGKARKEEWIHHKDAEFRDKPLWKLRVDNSCSVCEEPLSFLTVLRSEFTAHESHVGSRVWWCQTVISALRGRGGRKEERGQPGRGIETLSETQKTMPHSTKTLCLPLVGRSLGLNLSVLVMFTRC